MKIERFHFSMVETAARYERFASALTEAGYAVYANDHRGHGKTAGSVEKVGTSGDDAVQQRLWRHDTRRHPVRGRSKGPHHRSKLLKSMTFSGYNRAFRPVRTEFDWLSRDAEEVDKYIADPYCGVTATAQFYYYMLTGLRDIFKKEVLERIPKNLPICLLSGDRDPLGKNGKGVLRMYRTFKSLGIADVTCKLYPGGRHEMLNETNRDEVIRDIVDWLDARVGILSV